MSDERVPVRDAGPDLLEQMDYEHRDAHITKIIVWIAIFFAGTGLATLGILALYPAFVPNWYKAGQIPAPSPYRRLPPYPQLQAEPKHDIAAYRMAEDKQVAGLMGAVRNTKPAMTVDAAINQIAGDAGISGIKGTQEAVRGNSFPGSRDFGGTGAPAPAVGNAGVNESTTKEGEATGPAVQPSPEAGNVGGVPVEAPAASPAPPGPAGANEAGPRPTPPAPSATAGNGTPTATGGIPSGEHATPPGTKETKP